MALAENRKARFDYEILKKFEAGIELSGTEVKSARGGKMSLVGAFIGVRGQEAWLMGASVPPYQAANAPADYDATRARKLLLSGDEIQELAVAEAEKGLTIVPLSVYNKGRVLKA